MFRKGLLLIIRKYYTVRIYSNRYMLCVYVDWLLVGSITNLPTASIWVVALHRLFLYSDPPSLCHLPCDWLSLFSSQTFPLSIPQHSENHSFFISTPLWRWSDSVAKCMHIKLGAGELPRRNHTILLDYLQSLTYYHILWTTTAFYYFLYIVMCFNAAISSAV